MNPNLDRVPDLEKRRVESISGHIVDIEAKRVFKGVVEFQEGKILSVHPSDTAEDQFILPGLIDAHIHIESSMLVPAEFARLATPHGTVATVSDPHEIGNVLGIEGVRYMLENGRQVPFHFYFGAPSCVPATSFETAGAKITPTEIRELFTKDKLLYLSEMMNYPGVLSQDPEVMEKIHIAQELNLPIDGHAPGLKGEEAKRYVSAGISTDHECFTLEEAREKLSYGMKILIREGSAAKNYEALHPLISSHPQQVMFCSDDKHPDDLLEGHIDQIVKRSIANQHDVMDVLRAACINPVKHYNLDVGLLKEGDSADFIVVDDLQAFNVLKTYIKGRLVAREGKTEIPSIQSSIVNNFKVGMKREKDFLLKAEGETLQVIQALDGELITEKSVAKAKIVNGYALSDPDNDLLKITVVNRYQERSPAIAFIRGFGLKSGALASCVAHDSHNIVAAGVSERDLCQAVNAIIKQKGGIAAASDSGVKTLPLPVAGLMSVEKGESIAEKYLELNRMAKELGTQLQAPFMTLSFMALLVIPSLKLSDKGLFDGSSFTFTPLFPEQSLVSNPRF